MRWSRAVAWLFLLILAAAGSAAENKPAELERVRLGEFIPASPPLPAPAVRTGNEAINSNAATTARRSVMNLNLGKPGRFP